jgi:hypothetical protein
VQRRLKRLREAAILDLKSVGSPTFFVTSLQIERATGIDRATPYLANGDNPNVTCSTTSMVLTVIKRSLAIPVP